MNENPFSPIGEEMEKEYAKINEEMSEECIGRDEFAHRTGITPQTVSYHLRTGLLKRWVDSGDIQTEPYQIPIKLVDWFLTHNGRKLGSKISKAPFSVVEEKAIPSSQISEKILEQQQKTWEKLLEKYEEDLRIAHEELKRLSDLNSELNNQLFETSHKLARLEGEAKGKDELLSEKDRTIEAKNQTINAANAAVMLMEQQRSQALSVKTSDGSESDSTENRRNWVQRLLSREKK